jgi:hemerythrin-like domain-containing protein
MTILVIDKRHGIAEPSPTAPIDPKLFLEPAEFLLADHNRQRGFWRQLETLAVEPRTPGTRAGAEAALTYLHRDLVWHTEDEEQQVFPRLRERMPPGDGTADLLILLERDHRADRKLVDELLEPLDRLAGGEALRDPAEFAVRTRILAELERRHLAWENALIIPQAWRLLNSEDKLELGRKMARRRAMAFPG